MKDIFQVSVKYSKDRVKAGEDVTLVISAKPGSSVFLLGVDKSVRILKDGNDITQEKVSFLKFGITKGIHLMKKLLFNSYYSDSVAIWHHSS